MTTSRYHGQPLPIVVKFPSDPLVPYGKDYGDIEDISMNLKKVLATDADDRYLEKKQSSGGVVLTELTHEFAMDVTESDYEELSAGVTYYLTVNVKVSGVDDFIELDLTDRMVKITKDVNRE
jgi:hypothetical protein